jgi:hypothetical protein
MKNILLVLLFLVANSGFSFVVLKQVNLPENWKIEKIDAQKKFSWESLVIPSYVKQNITTADGALVIEYFNCEQDALAENIKNIFITKKMVFFREKNVIISVEGETKDIKNVSRFLQLPLSQQIKITVPDITQDMNLDLLTEIALSADEIKSYNKKFGIKSTSGFKQIYQKKDTNIKLETRYFQCKDKYEANIGYRNARLQNNNDLISFTAAESFLIEMEWTK